MKCLKYLAVVSIAFVAVAAVMVGAGVIDVGTAVHGVIVAEGVTAVDLKKLEDAMEKAFKALGDTAKKAQDTAAAALEEVRKEGSLFGKTSETLKALGEQSTAIQAAVAELQTKYNVVFQDGQLVDRVKDLEQRAAHKPGNDGPEKKTAGVIVTESEEYKRAAANPRAGRMDPVMVGSLHRYHNAAITNTTGQNQPLVPAERIPGIIMPGLRRFTVRDLIPQRVTTGNLIEFCRELVFTNNAGPQWDATSPVPHQEGATKNESGITFELANQAVTTLAHWIPASRQVLSDAPMLQSYVEGRLTYGLKLEEEDEMLNGSGSSGELNGLRTQQTAFTGGRTNAAVLDTLLRAFLQVSLAEYEATGVVLHPRDWVEEILTLKDNEGRYLFADPHNMTEPRVWGKPVVATQSMTQGQFLTGSFALAAEIWDREDAVVRVAEQHADFFVKNMVVVLVEERLALVVLRPTAIVGGSLTHTG